MVIDIRIGVLDLSLRCWYTPAITPGTPTFAPADTRTLPDTFTASRSPCPTCIPVSVLGYSGYNGAPVTTRWRITIYSATILQFWFTSSATVPFHACCGGFSSAWYGSWYDP